MNQGRYLGTDHGFFHSSATFVIFFIADCSEKYFEQKLYYAILPFRAWNHLFLCDRSQFESNMCLFCTKIYLRNKKLSRLIEKKLTVDVLKHFPSQLSYGVISGGCVNLFVHSSVIDRQKVFDESANFGTIFYEVINSPFILLKFYLDILVRIVAKVAKTNCFYFCPHFYEKFVSRSILHQSIIYE